MRPVITKYDLFAIVSQSAGAKLRQFLFRNKEQVMPLLDQAARQIRKVHAERRAGTKPGVVDADLVDREESYTVWDRVGSGWVVDRSYSGAFFVPGSGGTEYITSTQHAVMPQGQDPNAKGAGKRSDARNKALRKRYIAAYTEIMNTPWMGPEYLRGLPSPDSTTLVMDYVGSDLENIVQTAEQGVKEKREAEATTAKKKPAKKKKKKPTVADAVEWGQDPGYKSGKIKVWYTRPKFTRDMREGTAYLKKAKRLPDTKNLKRTHALLGSVSFPDMPTAFVMLQGERWSPRGEARDLIRGLGLGHTSMSIGDIFQIGRKFFMVDRAGAFTDLAFPAPKLKKGEGPVKALYDYALSTMNQRQKDIVEASVRSSDKSCVIIVRKLDEGSRPAGYLTLFSYGKGYYSRNRGKTEDVYVYEFWGRKESVPPYNEPGLRFEILEKNIGFVETGTIIRRDYYQDQKVNKYDLDRIFDARVKQSKFIDREEYHYPTKRSRNLVLGHTMTFKPGSGKRATFFASTSDWWTE